MALLLSGCGGDTSSGDDSSGQKKESGASGAAAEPVTLETEARKATLTDRDKKSHDITVEPKSLRRGAASDLENVRLKDDLKGMQPYYLTVSFTNGGEEPLTRPGLTGKLSLVDAAGVPGKAITLMSGFSSTQSGKTPKCSGNDPVGITAGDTVEVCALVMMAKGAAPATVAYADDNSDTLLWKAGDGKSDSDSVLPKGKSADSAVDRSGDLIPITATPKSVREGSLDDLSRFRLSDATRKKVPYYVTIQYRNNGDQDVLPSMAKNVVLNSAGGVQSQKLTLISIGGPGVEQCPDAVPNEMVKPGATVTECSIHFLPKGDRPATVSFKSADPEPKWTFWRASS
ncbi:hypothetical protein H3146_23795 [Streptomyces sp. OF3]|uniref:DUF4352 domain-containing protein n=1 Tax=Streptomyces alkaliterrae TaxID=2213162 RepID=A0A7W3WPX7_9ACTN|nr:hypothetical protein [Streptomyces alkaliterrae]MBB1256353.1 hypothetical protein [Streptomyces alkaliterrae]